MLGCLEFRGQKSQRMSLLIFYLIWFTSARLVPASSRRIKIGEMPDCCIHAFIELVPPGRSRDFKTSNSGAPPANAARLCSIVMEGASTGYQSRAELTEGLCFSHPHKVDISPYRLRPICLGTHSAVRESGRYLQHVTRQMYGHL